MIAHVVQDGPVCIPAFKQITGTNTKGERPGLAGEELGGGARARSAHAWACTWGVHSGVCPQHIRRRGGGVRVVGKSWPEPGELRVGSALLPGSPGEKTSPLLLVSPWHPAGRATGRVLGRGTGPRGLLAAPNLSFPGRLLRKWPSASPPQGAVQPQPPGQGPCGAAAHPLRQAGCPLHLSVAQEVLL